MAQKFPLEVVVRAVDKMTPVFRAMAVNAQRVMLPFNRLGQAMSGLSKALNLPKLGEAIGGFGGALKNVGQETFNLGLKLAGLAAGAAFAFFGIVKGAVGAGDELKMMAGRLGLSVDQFSSLREAASRADVEAEEFNTSMDKFVKNLGEMKVGKGGGEFLKFLNEVSPTLAKQIKSAKGTEQAFFLVADAMEKVTDPTKRAVFQQAAFGKSGKAMGAFLGQGAVGISQAQAAVMRLMGSQEELASNSDELDNALKDVNTAFKGLWQGAIAKLMPALTNLSGIVTDFLVKNRDGLKKWAMDAGAAIQKWIDGGGFERLVASLRSVADAVVRVIDYLGPVGTAFAGLGILAAPLIGSLGSLALAGVNLAIAAFPLLVNATAALWPVVASLGTALWGALAPIAPFIAAGAALAYLGKTIYDNWAEISFLFRDWGNSLKWAVIDAWETVRPILEKLAGVFGGNGFFGGALAAGNALSKSLRPSSGGAPMGAATAATASPMLQSSQSTEARVSVDFANLPRGARVSTEPNSSQPVDLNVGYSSVLP